MSSTPSASAGTSALVTRLDGTVPVIVAPSAIAFDALREMVRSELPALLPEIGGRVCRLNLGAREIKLFDLRRLIHLLRDEFSVEVTGLYALPEVVHRFAERELKLKLFALVDDVEEAPPPAVMEVLVEVEDEDEAETEGIGDPASPEEPKEEPEEAPIAPHILPAPVPAENAAPEQPGRRTLTVHRTVRSGSVVRFDGDITIFGDVNPGAQVIAAGNIMVLGALKGVAHAGATGDEQTFILGFNLSPIQLRIGRKIAIPPDQKQGGRPFSPEMATVVDGQIIIGSYRGPIFR